MVILSLFCYLAAFFTNFAPAKSITADASYKTFIYIYITDICARLFYDFRHLSVYYLNAVCLEVC